MSIPTKILITGSSGYVGHFLAVHFAQQGIPVIGVDLSPHILIRDIPNFKFVALDVRNGEVLRRVMEKEQPSHVIHLAFINHAIHDSGYQHDVNVIGSRNAIEAANAVPSVRQFILMSSSLAYGARPDNPDWIKEDRPLAPIDDPHGIHRMEAEEMANQCKRRKDLRLVVLRMCKAVGPSYYKKGGVVSSLFHAPILPAIAKSNGKVQFIHEEDVKAVLDKVAKEEDFQGVYNLSPNDFLSTKELGIRLKKKLFPVPLSLLKAIFWVLWHLRLTPFTPAHARLMAYGVVVSPEKLINSLGYTFKYNTREAIMDAIEKRRQNGTL